MKTKIIIIIAIMTAVAIVSTRSCLAKKQRKKQDLAAAKAETVIATSRQGTTHANREDIATTQKLKEVIKKEYIPYIADTLAPILKIKEQQITELTRVKAELSGELRAAYKTIDTLRNGARDSIITYKGPYMELSTHSNSQTVRYRYHALLNILGYRKRKNAFSRYRNFIDVSSPDPNFRINGLERYKKQVSFTKNKMALSWNSHLVMGLKDQRYNRLSTGLNLNIAPEGRLSPYVGAGYLFSLYYTGEITPYIQGGVNMDLLKF